ncbi:PAS domain S-box protein [Microcoleus vaginatus]|uniref:PAS domain S-box protein n=1 Tax=Microcoleus vaginatus TaxID=119532 RepID=UPI001F60145B|nr:PAS domain S-box protein [Microcoleus vaginatus HSN003]
MNQRISHMASILVIAIGCLVLLGWQFDISLLKSGFPGMTSTMKANSAICFLLAGVSLRLLQYQRIRLHNRIAQGIAGFIIIISLLTLSQYIFGWKLGIDEWLFRDFVSSATRYPGRMGVNTALNFVLMGVGLLLVGQNSQRHTWLAQILSSVAALISLLALFAHLFHVDILERLVTVRTTQPINTIVAFFTLYGGILLLRPNEGLMQVVTSPQVGGVMVRWLLPWATIFPVTLNWFTLQGQKLGWYNANFGYTLRSTLMVVTFSILILTTARFLNQIDYKGQQAEKEIKKLNENLEILVAERTDALQKSQTRFAGILEIANDAIISVDRTQRITLFNQGAEKMFGYKMEDILGEPLNLLLPEQFRDAHPQHIKQFAHSPTRARRMGERGEILGRRRDGTQFSAEASISRLEMGDETVFTVILRDISDRKQIEMALRNSEEQFRHAFEDASIGMAIVSLDGNWIKVNPALCQILGYSSEELLALTFQDITHPDDLDGDLTYAQELLAGTISTYQLEKRYFHKQGHIIWIILNGSVVQDGQGNPLHFISQIQEITARKEAQETLEIQSIIMNNMGGGVCLIKASDLTIVYTNPTFDAMFGYTEGELAGQSVGVLNYVDTKVTPDVTVRDILTQIEQSGEAKYEVHNKKKDGTLFWCRVHTSMFEHPEYGTVYVAVQEDATELKLAEQALQATTNRLNFLLNYSPVVIFSSKSAGDYGVTFISENIKDVLGYESREFLEDSKFWVNHLHPDDVEPVLHGLPNVLVNDFYFHEYRFHRSDGVYRWMLGQLRLIRDHSGTPVEILGYLIDISDRKQAELEFHQANEANEAKTVFLANMSHELRTPLNSILGFTQLMSYERNLTPSLQERLQIVNRSGRHLLDLINDILDLSKIESGRMTLNLSDFDLTNLLASIEEMFQVKVQSKELQLIFELAPDIPKFVHSDEKKLYQVFVNLLGNAIKFTNQGSVTLRVRATQRDKTSCHLCFEVEDTGVGISPTEIDSLFKVFVQAQAGNKLSQGSGLGLAISQKLVKLMGGQIRVKSTLHRGSTFSFEIPVQLPQAESVPPELSNQRVIGLAPGQPNYRILIVEDLEENRRLLVEILTSVGFEVREAKQGVEALSLWESWQPHLILMDLRMPIVDGYTATKYIRERPQSQETVIIALTASVFEEEREKVLMAGFNDFISKPFQQKEIFDKLAKYLGVTYIYEAVEQTPQKQLVETVSVEDLSIMPPQWLEQMYQAAYYLDTEVMNELIGQIPASKASLSQALTDYINNFNSDRIMELIRPLLPNPL